MWHRPAWLQLARRSTKFLVEEVIGHDLCMPSVAVLSIWCLSNKKHTAWHNMTEVYKSFPSSLARAKQLSATICISYCILLPQPPQMFITYAVPHEGRICHIGPHWPCLCRNFQREVLLRILMNLVHTEKVKLLAERSNAQICANVLYVDELEFDQNIIVYIHVYTV